MNKFTKLLVVATALFAYSCAVDSTTDLSVSTDIGKTTEFTLSLEDSRTQLGEKVGDLYPLYWSEGDQISINGNASEPLGANYNGAATATFSVSGTLLPPFGITYPAAPANQVVFAEKQTHTGNATFGSGVSTMYAYSTDGSTGEIKHLTGVLKFGVTGSATLVKAQISTIDRKPIAGAFAFDFEKGVATATKASKSLIEYSFGEGVQLSSEPTYLHVAVPAGVYGDMYVTLYDAEGGVMYATIKANEEKPLVAGNIREFSNAIEYAADEAIFIIKDKASLLAWGAQAATSNAHAVMVADVDMTGENWTSVEGFAGIFSGNGYSIKGLNAPLFGTTDAMLIEGIHLEDVDIEISNVGHAGALVCWTQQHSNSIIRNCSTSGKMVVTQDGSITENTYIGGAIGRHTSSDAISGVVNKVDIEVKGTYTPSVILGGVAGSAAAADMVKCVNLGNIVFNGESSGIIYIGGITRAAINISDCVNGSKDDATGETGKIVINGIHKNAVVVAGIIENKGSTSGTNCHNYGNIYYQSASSTKWVQLCGLVRFNKENQTYWTDCSNHGDIIVTGSTDDSFILGGFSTRHFQTCVYQNCHNYGDITVKAEASATMIAAGGLMGTNDDTGEVCYLYECSNSGNIEVYSAAPNKVYLGGFNGKLEAGQCLIGLQNDPTIVAVNNGNILYEAENKEAVVYIGGISGLVTDNLTSGVTEVSSAHRVAYTTNNGDITVNGSCHTLNVGGLTGRYAKGTGKGATLYYALIDSTNNGDITVNATVESGACAIGGLLGYQIHTFSTVAGNWINNGKLTFTGTVVGDRLLVGGFVGATDRAFSGKNNTIYNFGDIECTGKVNTAKNNRIGGVYGQTNKTFANCHVYFTMMASGYSHVGMLTGCERTSAVIGSNCSVGGRVGTYDIENEEYEYETIKTSNFYKHLYGGSTDWTGVDNYDNCTLLTKKPTL